ncbi:nucleotidyltransferase [Terribacillus sp. DMT04]|uniref:nucleotidyltransferase n=1 Tax=Terribacillus sp. DMT04 TaxID=2850441 RepID=UPI001C2CC4F7|nr:nucleotidyltransferase [Terribacillus sp. DMT04]QXE02834.1 nucleotidyltransferase [Terribacillus sp. DMT04]
MTQIKNIGRFCPNDDAGYIINEANQTKIASAYSDLIEKVILTYKRKLGSSLHSIYLRGSIPRGLGILGVSDLDTICITKDRMKDTDLAWISKAEEELNNSFPCVSGIEMSVYSIEDVCDTQSFSIIPFMIKTHSVCVLGEDVSSLLPSYKADKTLANHHIVHLKGQIEQARMELQNNEDKEDVLDCCSWIMKIIVRAGLAFVLDYEKHYTRDLYPAYEVFAKHYPQYKANMSQALEYAINPVSDWKQLVAFLDELEERLVREADKWLLHHNPHRVRNMKLHS